MSEKGDRIRELEYRMKVVRVFELACILLWGACLFAGFALWAVTANTGWVIAGIVGQMVFFLGFAMCKVGLEETISDYLDDVMDEAEDIFKK